jgi:hypothetical protein
MKTEKEKLEYLAKNMDPFQGEQPIEIQKILEELQLTDLSPIQLTNYLLKVINS